MQQGPTVPPRVEDFSGAVHRFPHLEPGSHVMSEVEGDKGGSRMKPSHACKSFQMQSRFGHWKGAVYPSYLVYLWVIKSS